MILLIKESEVIVRVSDWGLINGLVSPMFGTFPGAYFLPRSPVVPFRTSPHPLFKRLLVSQCGYRDLRAAVLLSEISSYQTVLVNASKMH